MSTITYDHENVTSLFKMLLGANADAWPAKVAGCPAPRVVATYVSATGEVLHALAISLAAANGAGAALTRIPPARADEGTKSGTVPDGIRENLQEIFNICVNCFPGDGSGRMVLGNIYFPGDVVDPALTARIDQVKSTVTLEVDLGGYGKGKMVLV